VWCLCSCPHLSQYSPHSTAARAAAAAYADVAHCSEGMREEAQRWTTAAAHWLEAAARCSPRETQRARRSGRSLACCPPPESDRAATASAAEAEAMGLAAAAAPTRDRPRCRRSCWHGSTRHCCCCSWPDAQAGSRSTDREQWAPASRRTERRECSTLREQWAPASKRMELRQLMARRQPMAWRQPMAALHWEAARRPLTSSQRRWTSQRRVWCVALASSMLVGSPSHARLVVAGSRVASSAVPSRVCSQAALVSAQPRYHIHPLTELPLRTLPLMAPPPAAPLRVRA
jgi:hypothetical protein